MRGVSNPRWLACCMNGKKNALIFSEPKLAKIVIFPAPRPCEKVAQVDFRRRPRVATLCCETTCAGTFRPRPLGATAPSGTSTASVSKGAKWLGRPPGKLIAH
jgi:hypothetical protein